ncbi:MAG TPA: caspase family protein, partial [Ktedonobacteraceae bacterium]|nr:caspase family protein [Ktedonobacteraceae bacterium]
MTASPELSNPGKRLALVVGVNTTESEILPPLKHALADATAVAEVLQQRCGFTLFEPPLLGDQADSGSLHKSILHLARDRGPDDFLLFYFSGHGQQTSERQRPAMRQAYLGTADFDERDVEDDPHSHHISMHWLRDVLFQSTQAGQVLIVLDCCFAEDIRTASDHSLDALRSQLEYYFEIPGAEVKQRTAGIRAALAAARYDQPSQEAAGHGAMTNILLQVLRGEVPALL